MLSLLRNDQSKLDVLEAGCRAGRFSEILLGYPATRLKSVDMSSAVEANHVNIPQNERHSIVQCDICEPPFRPRAYVLVLCVGVVQHTPSPEETIETAHKSGCYTFEAHHKTASSIATNESLRSIGFNFSSITQNDTAHSVWADNSV